MERQISQPNHSREIISLSSGLISRSSETQMDAANTDPQLNLRADHIINDQSYDFQAVVESQTEDLLRAVEFLSHPHVMSQAISHHPWNYTTRQEFSKMITDWLANLLFPHMNSNQSRVTSFQNNSFNVVSLSLAQVHYRLLLY